MKQKLPARWIMILLLAFMTVVFISWLVYRHYMHLLDYSK